MTPLVNGEFLLHKYPGKGGWTYAALPEIPPDRKNPFGWRMVRGTIDGFELRQYKLMPMGDGKLFLPVRAEIRKKINKEAGDYVHVVLYADDSSFEVPMEILDCFEQEDTRLFQTFSAFSDSEKKAYIDWIYEAKTPDTRARRILEMMEHLHLGLKFFAKNG